MTINKIHTARRSALLSSTDTNGMGVRPGIEQKQTISGALQSGYGLDTFVEAKLEAFQHAPDVSIEVGKLGLVLVVSDGTWTDTEPFTADFFLPNGNSGEVSWVGFVSGKEIWIDEAETVNGLYTIGAKLSTGEILTYTFDPTVEWFVPQFSASVLTQPRTRQMIKRLAA